MSEMYYSAEKQVQVVVSLLKSYGIKKIIASPGTTNLTFVASLQCDPFFEMYSAPEERSAAYMAVGMAEESGEPVVITCTGATASRNYLPGLTEAFYRKLPVIAITASQSRIAVGQYIPQVIDRSVLPVDTCGHSIHIPIAKDKEDISYAVLKVNEAFHYLRKNGGGPIHINLETGYNKDFGVRELPRYKMIKYYEPFSEIPEINNGRVGIYIGSHHIMDEELTNAIDNFCDMYGAVVYCDHTSNYKGKYRYLCSLALSQDNWCSAFGNLSHLIHIGGVSGAYSEPKASRIWRVNPDGNIRSPFGLPDAVFDMREIDFFNLYTAKGAESRPSYIDDCRAEYEKLLNNIPDSLPFSNIWVARFLSKMVPQNAVMHFGILNSLRSWNFFEIHSSIDAFSNVGGFGIDGPLSSAIGGALAQPNRMHFVIVGDLAFFYDLNSLGNRHLPSNLRIVLVNNGRGTEFTNYNHPAYAFGRDADKYMAAAGHYGYKSKQLVKHLSKDFGFRYFSASKKEELVDVADLFMCSGVEDSPMLLEVFTDSTEETEALHIMRTLNSSVTKIVENKIRSAIGPKGVDIIKKVLKK